ncbi:hypothetical protein PASLES2_14465 [Pseudomonas aeruginosa]
MSDSIDADLLDYYQRELTWLRHAGGAFAERYPKVARRLQLAPGECPDPHVERLLEGFSLLTARLQRRLDDDYAEFSDALLEQLYPLALRPLPSCAIVQFEPDPTQGNLAEGYRLPRDTALFVTTRGGDSVHFRSSAEATLWPLAIDEATLLGGEEAQALTGVGAARSALRLSLRCLGEYRWDELSIERLRIHLAASPMGCAILYDLLAAHAVQVMAGAPGTPPAALRGLPEIVGFAADEALLPEEDGGHPGLRLLAEYFAFPDKFHFFDLPLSGALADGQTLYLYLVFDRAPTARLHLQAEDFQLGCAPAINLFPRTSEPLRPDGTRSEYRLVADSHRENSVEIHSIRAVRSVAGSTVQPVPAYYGCRHDSHLGTLYWHARRIAGLTPNRLGSDLLLSLVDTGFDPLREAPAFSLTAELLCTNRYLAERLGAGTALGFERPWAGRRRTPAQRAQRAEPAAPGRPVALETGLAADPQPPLAGGRSARPRSPAGNPRPAQPARRRQRPPADRRAAGPTASGWWRTSARMPGAAGAMAWKSACDSIRNTSSAPAACCSPPCWRSSSRCMPPPTASCARSWWKPTRR